MADEKLSPERAVRLLWAKAAELEARTLATYQGRELDDLTADIALVMSLLADHMEHCGLVVYPGDKLIITSTDKITREQAEEIQQAVTDFMPGSVVVISGMTATVQRAERSTLNRLADMAKEEEDG